MIFTLIPLAFMAGGAYSRARGLLRDQAASQLENLLTNQVDIVNGYVQYKEAKLQEQFEGASESAVEAALNLDPQSSQLETIHGQLNENLLQGSTGGINGFSQYLFLDGDGVVRLSSNEDWQGLKAENIVELTSHEGIESKLLNSFAPFYDSEQVFVTTAVYTAKNGGVLGTLIGVTDGSDLLAFLQPLSGLAPRTQAYFVISNNELLTVSPDSNSFTSVQIEDKSARLVNDVFEGKTSDPKQFDVTLSNGTVMLAQGLWLPSIQSTVILAVDTKSVFERINSLAPFTLILFAVTIAAMAAALYVGARRVIQPLRELTSATQKIADGEHDVRVNISNADNEIGILSASFNKLADQIQDNYKTLERKVEERTLQIRTAAEVAQSITTIPNVDDMLRKTAELLVQHFDFYQASIFMLDRSGKNIEFKYGYGSATKELLDRKYSLPVDSESMIGWVAANNQPRVILNTSEDERHLMNELLPEARSEACVPISLGKQLIGVLDAQSASASSSDSIIMLQTLASQLAAGIQTANLTESSQVNFQELDRLYRSSRLIAEAKGQAEIMRVGGQILKSAPYPALLFQCQKDHLKLNAVAETFQNDVPASMQQNGAPANIQELASFLQRGTIASSITNAELLKPLKEILRALNLLNAVIMPIKGTDTLEAIILIGSRQQNLSAASLQPYENLADLMSVTLQRAMAITQMEKHLKEVESLASMNELISSTSEIQSFYNALHGKIQQIIGDYSLVVAIYNSKDDTIHIPFSYEMGTYQIIDPFPLGEGLTSILLKTRQPLMLVKDTEKRAMELGAKIIGSPPRSWMGTPMIVQGEVIGAMIIQDVENEGAFNEDDLKFFTTIASQVAGVIKNTQLLQESRQKAIQVEAAAEIARDISGSFNLDELLNKAVNLIRERFSFYHAGIFLLDQPGEFAVIREATGEAGAQLKREGHKIGVGSKSIVGYVSGKGEALIVSDTAKDLTYYANPLLPDTRAEAAIPMRIADRILGVLDVQSIQPYAFTEDNLKSLRILADQLAIAVQNSELFAETQEHLSQHRLLHHITSTAASGTTLEEALESAVSGLQVTLGGDRVIIMLVDREKKMLEIKASIGYTEDISSKKVEIGQGVTGWVASHRRSLRLGDVRKDARYIETAPNTRSELAIPLIYRNEVLGVINVESEQTDAYTENDEEMLGTLGGSLAAVIANARLLEQIRAQSERERLINEITAKIRRSTDIQSILHTTASEIAKVTGAKYTKIQVEPGVEPSTEKETH
ncbi:hypothetical protein MASR2M66_08090 [Chloroflexota bacterium]